MRTTIRNIIYSVAGNGLSLLVSVCMILIVPKILELKDYGYWQLFLFYFFYLRISTSDIRRFRHISISPLRNILRPIQAKRNSYRKILTSDNRTLRYSKKSDRYLRFCHTRLTGI